MQNDNQVAIKEMLKSFAYLLEEGLKSTTKVYDGIVVSISNNQWSVRYNGEVHSLRLYGKTIPKVNSMVKVFVPQGNQSLAWFFVPTEVESNDGATFIPEVSSEGIISWTNNKNLPNPTPVDIKGPQGVQGEQGIQGQKGDKGEVGPQGIEGKQGKVGPYYTPAVDSQGILSWENNGQLPNPVSINIKGPQGDKGTAATINGVSVLTITATGGLTGVQSGSIFSIDGSKIPFSNHISSVITTTGWVGNIFSVAIEGMTENHTPIIIPKWTADIKKESKEWNKILTVQAFDNLIKIESLSAFETSVQFEIFY